jgi:hypothetical protein
VENSKIVDYDFEIYRIQGGMYGWVPFSIRVRDGRAVSMNPAVEYGELDRVDGYEEFDTVEKAFDRIREAYDKEHFVEVGYNDKYGYPEKMRIDSLESDQSGFTIEIRKLSIIKDD